MKCKQHITDGSSRVGVCASCLRERLFVLVEAQARSEAVLSLQQQIDHEDHRKSDPINNYHEDHRKSDPINNYHSTQPQSVSPYNIVDSSWHHQNQNSRFYSTPQLGPTNRTNDTANTNPSSCSTTHKKKSRFGILSNLFRSSNRSAVVVIDEQPQIPDPPSTISRASLSTSSPIPSSTWYSSLIPNRRKTTQESPCRSTTNHHHHRHRPHRNKGLSPKYTEEEEEYNIGGGGGEEDGNTIGYVSEASPGWRKSSSTTTPGRQRRGGQNGNNSKSVGMAFCLSPLVRPSPKRSSHKKDGGGSQTGFSAEIRVSSSVHNHNHHIPPNLSTAASFCANRSRKIANFGRYNNYNNP